MADLAGPQKRTKKEPKKAREPQKKPSKSQRTVPETPEELRTATKTRFCAIYPRK